MKLTETDKKKILNKFKQTNCPLCHNDKWILNDIVFFLSEFHDDGLHVGGPAFPVVPLTCTNCGNTYFINTIIAGVTKTSSDKQDVK